MSFLEKSTQRNMLFTAVFLGMLFSQIGYGKTKNETPETVSTLPSASVLKALDFGLDSATASLLWLKVNQGVYTWINDNHKYERFSKEIITITDLDPDWGFPYAFGTLLLPGLGKAHEGIALGEKGLKNAPNDWRIPYYMAIVYNGDLKDRVNSAKYFAIASITPGAPENVKTVAKNYGTGKSQLDEMEIIWKALYENADNEILKNQAEKYLLYIQELKKKGVK